MGLSSLRSIPWLDLFISEETKAEGEKKRHREAKTVPVTQPAREPRFQPRIPSLTLELVP